MGDDDAPEAPLVRTDVKMQGLDGTETRRPKTASYIKVNGPTIFYPHCRKLLVCGAHNSVLTVPYQLVV